jgi:hypothetical protein
MEPRMSMSDLMRMEFKQAFEEFDKVTVPVHIIQYKRSTKRFKKRWTQSPQSSFYRVHGR